MSEAGGPSAACRRSEPVEWIEGIEPSPACPVSEMLELWPAFQAWLWLDRHGILPTAGGWAEQSPVFIECMEVIEACRPRSAT